jgi:acyloxyacyl hydrolase
MIQTVVLVILCALAPTMTRADNGGGIECAACAVVLTLTDQLSQLHNQTVEELLVDICSLFPVEFGSICTYFVETYGPEVVKLFEQEFTADEICHYFTFCTDPTCTLVSKSKKHNPKKMVKSPLKYIYQHQQRLEKKRSGINPWDWLLDLLKPIIDKSEPIIDFDGDTFSTDTTLRGTSWRGRDCNDFEASIYPGRKTSNYDPLIDHDCNGIYEKNGVDYEKLFCAGSGQLGVAVIGDSAGAHFHIPPDWMNASAIDKNTFSNLLFVLSNELDWPQQSATTGHVNSTATDHVSSIYLKLKERNRCNHRDYQNICKNGLRSGSSIDMAKTIARDQTADYPVLLTYELIGNDAISLRFFLMAATLYLWVWLKVVYFMKPCTTSHIQLVSHTTKFTIS